MGIDDQPSNDPVAVDLAATYSIATAQRVLVEQLHVDLDGALTLLDHRAQRAGIPLVEAARWLLTAGTLP
ncbi:hypothetical protein GCM10009789_42040 [Kribbella sancticallisti]|uniref:ANTAR domain-containing protein n=1 Tax=Kribbella sancticallisti TaxID=460087 RepID=A0ABP4PKH5_9ACTN